MQQPNIKKRVSPWAWVSTLYFAEGLPNAAVVLVSLVFYQEMGLSDAEATFYTSWFLSSLGNKTIVESISRSY